MFQVGDVIGSYTILAHLRTGGMASLYLARRTGAAGFSRVVAIKVVHPRLSDDSALIRMFVDEAKITARIEHPNVVHVEELGETEGTYYLVMEYVHGCSLAQLMRALGRSKRRLSPLVAVAICARVAEGLHAAHETTGDDGQLLGIVHRDVSPQNILLSHRGHVKLIDFGIAKAKLDRAETNTRSLKGKVRYMAPEQATTGKVDRRTDVYALGIVLWELLTMRRLFSGRTEFEILMNVRKPHVVPPSRYATEIPADLDAVVLRALAPDPDQRFANAKELRRQLVRALPRAAGIDSAHLADLLVNVVGDALDQERHELPHDVSRVLRAEQQRVVGLEKAEREQSAEQPLEAPVADASGVVDAYTLHSGEVQYEDESPAEGRALPGEDEENEAAPTERAQRPPAEALAPRTAIPTSTPDPARARVRAPLPQVPEEDTSPTEVSSESPIVHASAAAKRATELAPKQAAAVPRDPVPRDPVPRDPSEDPFRSPEPVEPAPRGPDRSLVGYGVALGASMAIGVALALWAPSCGGATVDARPITPVAATPEVVAGTAAPPPPGATPAVPTSPVPEAAPAPEPRSEPRPRVAAPGPGRRATRGRAARAPAPSEPAEPAPRGPSIVGGVPIARDLQ